MRAVVAEAVDVEALDASALAAVEAAPSRKRWRCSADPPGVFRVAAAGWLLWVRLERRSMVVDHIERTQSAA